MKFKINSMDYKRRGKNLTKAEGMEKIYNILLKIYP